MRIPALLMCLFLAGCTAPEAPEPAFTPVPGTGPQLPQPTSPPPSTPPPPIPPPPPDTGTWLTGRDPVLAPTGDPRLDAWRARVFSEGGVAWRPYLLRAFQGVAANPRILDANAAMVRPRDAGQWIRSLVTQRRVAAGSRHYRELRSNAVLSRSPAPLELMIAIWGAESDYGERMPEFDMIETIANLGAHSRGQHWGAFDIYAATALLATSGLPRTRLKAYTDGTIGQTGWWPATWLRWAKDGDGDGRKDIWTNRLDILASLASTLHGWERGQPAILPIIGLDPKDPRQAHALRGGSLIAAGPNGPWFRQSLNFSLIYYTHDVMKDRPPEEREGYALAIALLAEAIAGRPVPLP